MEEREYDQCGAESGSWAGQALQEVSGQLELELRFCTVNSSTGKETGQDKEIPTVAHKVEKPHQLL